MIKKPKELLPRDFFKFWLGESISFVGSEVSRFSLPLIFVLSLHASALQLGWATAAELGPVIMLGLWSGVGIDRLPKRQILMGWDFLAAMLIGIVPLAATMHVLSISLLYAVIVLLGCVSAFGAAWHAFLPELVNSDSLGRANSWLTASAFVASLIGPGLAALLVEWLTPPGAILVDAVSYLVALVCLARIRHHTHRPDPRSDSARRGIGAEITEGLKILWANSLMRAVTFVTLTPSIVSAMWRVLYVLYVIRYLKLTVPIYGILAMAGALEGIMGAVVRTRLWLRWAIGPLTGVASLLFVAGFGGVAMTTAHQDHGVTIDILAISAVVSGLSSSILDINLNTLRQLTTPGQFLGRIFTTQRIAMSVLAIIGGLSAGVFVDTLGYKYCTDHCPKPHSAPGDTGQWSMENQREIGCLTQLLTPRPTTGNFCRE